MHSIQGIVVASLALVLVAPTVGQAARPDAMDCDASHRTVRAEIDAACPCDAAAGHPEYVRCVTKKLRELSACTQGADGTRSCGPVARLCAAKIRRIASRSACGQPATTITCCIPKQRDCVGDNTPGDGKLDGTCSGTTRRCDRITDCLVSRCELSPTKERCDLVGGKPGRGRDCANACAE